MIYYGQTGQTGQVATFRPSDGQETARDHFNYQAVLGSSFCYVPYNISKFYCY